MNNILLFICTLGIAALGGWLFQKIKFPAGRIVGALIFAGVFNAFTGQAYLPAACKPLVKALTGLFVGLRITIPMIKRLKTLLRPALILMLLIFSLCVGMGLILHLTTELDLVSALFSVAPGGLSDMTLMTMDMGGNAAIVAVLQTIRLLAAFCVSMPLAKILSAHFPQTSQTVLQQQQLSADPAYASKLRRILFTVLVTVIGGAAGYYIGNLLNFSVMILIGAMIACATANISTGKLYMPESIRDITQILSGALIGSSVNENSIRMLRDLVLPVALICVGFTIISICMAMVLYKVCHMDLSTAMLSCIVGGASEITLIAGEFHAEVPTVVVLQIMRMVCTTLFYPFIVKVLVSAL